MPRNWVEEYSQDHCPDCRAGVGEVHADDCTVERCPYCGGQLLSCFCFGNDLEFVPLDDRMPWDRATPGVRECVEFGWFARRNPDGPGWVACSEDDPGAAPHFNRL